MTGETVAYSGVPVNTLCHVKGKGRSSAPDSAVSQNARKRLRALIDKHYPRSSGGIRRLCQDTGLTEEVVHSWFRPKGNEPQLGSLAKLAKGLKLTRAEIVAAMDGVSLPPDTTKEPPPWWAKAQGDLESEIVKNRTAITDATTAVQTVVALLPAYREALKEAQRQLAAESPAERGKKVPGKRRPPARRAS